LDLFFDHAERLLRVTDNWNIVTLSSSELSLLAVTMWQ